MDTTLKAVAGAVLGWLIEVLFADALVVLGVPRHTAKVAGALIGALA